MRSPKGSDPLLVALRDAARAERAASARWEPLLSGEPAGPRPADEAVPDDDVVDDELERALFTPLGDGARARIAAKLVAAPAEAASAPRSERPPASREVPGPSHDATPPARVLPFPRLLMALPLVAAAALALLFFRGRPADLPGYSLALAEGVSSSRASSPTPEAVTRLAPSTRLSLVARPDAPTRDPLVARGFLRQGGVVSALRLEPRRSDEGAFLIEGRAGDVLPRWTPGDAELVVVVGHAGKVPDEATARSDAKDARVLRVPVLLLPEP